MLALAQNWRDVPWSEADRAMLAYVELLALTPSKATAQHVAALRQAGSSSVTVRDPGPETAPASTQPAVGEGSPTRDEEGD